MAEQFTIIEYALIMLFVIIGATFIINICRFRFNIFMYRITEF